MHEASLHDENWFLTLTYSDDELPVNRELPSLCPPHLQKFFKRLRKAAFSHRYFACGEYGDRTGRPHYHAVMFGLSIPDLVKFTRRNGHDLFKSETLTRIWGHGDVVVGAVTPESIAYTARYCLKKLEGRPLDWYVDRGQYPEFVRMSRCPGIGRDWFLKFRSDVESIDGVSVGSFVSKPPRYYDKLAASFRVPLGKTIESFKDARSLVAQSRAEDSTPARLSIRETVVLAKLSRLPVPVH